jgi:hypothetical protein
VVKVVLDNDEPRRVLLGELVRKKHVAEEYFDMLRDLAKSDNPSERAYAIYLCGTKLGDKSINLVSGDKDRAGNLTMQECVALSFVELREQGKSYTDLQYSRIKQSGRRTRFDSPQITS